jgi:hypothetical protein
VSDDIDICDHGRPDHQELVRQLREAAGLPGPPLPISPKEAFEEALARVEDLRSIVSEVAAGMPTAGACPLCHRPLFGHSNNHEPGCAVQRAMDMSTDG